MLSVCYYRENSFCDALEYKPKCQINTICICLEPFVIATYDILISTNTNVLLSLKRIKRMNYFVEFSREMEINLLNSIPNMRISKYDLYPPKCFFNNTAMEFCFQLGKNAPETIHAKQLYQLWFVCHNFIKDEMFYLDLNSCLWSFFLIL